MQHIIAPAHGLWSQLSEIAADPVAIIAALLACIDLWRRRICCVAHSLPPHDKGKNCIAD